LTGNIAILAALPGELKYVLARRQWTQLSDEDGVKVWMHARGENRWIAVCAGMGAERAALAFNAALQSGPLNAVCSFGWAGSLDAHLQPGAVASAALVVDESTGERFQPDTWVAGMPVLVSTPSVANTVEKRRLASTYGAGLVDMEAATVARLARANGVLFHSIKAVSDAADAKLPELNRFIDSHGQMKMTQFLAHVAVRPATWASLLQLGRNSTLAAENLATALYDWLDEREYVRKRKVHESSQNAAAEPID
jgi:adenosylhomocysteine nucleosidase